MNNPISFVGIPKEFRSTFFHQLVAFSQALKEVHNRVTPLDENWKESVHAFVAECEEEFGLASRDIRRAIECGEHPDVGIRVCTNLAIFMLATLIGEIADEACPTRLVACIDHLTTHNIPIPSGLVCRSADGNFPPPADLTGWALQAQKKGGVWICYTDLTQAGAAAIILPVHNKAQRPLILTRSQQSALRRIRKLFEIRGTEMEWVAGIWSRPFPLICGISGSGKTTIVRHLAHEEDVPCVIVDSGSWIVRGAKSELYTLDDIRSCVRSSARGGVLLVDELDKFRGCESSWDRLIVQELMALLDGRLGSAGWTDDDLEHFKEWIVVGGATFQTDIKARVRALGFGGTPDYTEVVSDVLRVQTLIPEELVARFNARWIALEPPEYSDFCRQIRSILDELKYEPEGGIEKHIDRVASEAVESAQNMRFVEAYLSELIETKIQSDASFFDRSADDYLPTCMEDESDFELM